MSVSATTAPRMAAHPCVAASGRALTHMTTVPVTTATPTAGHSRVVGSARSLTHLKVRALTCSPTPWTDLAAGAATGY